MIPSMIVVCGDDIASSSQSYMMMMTSSNGDILRVTGPLCGEFTGYR